MAGDRIGMIGLGMMGGGMAAQLIAAGNSILVLAHRRRDVVDRLLGLGAEEVATAQALAERITVLVTCLPDATAVERIARDVADRLAPGAIWIDATTSRPETSRALAEKLYARGVRFSDAPVTGGPPQAEAGELASMVGCREDDWGDVQRVVGAYSKTINRFGEPGAGHTAKLLNNFITQGTTVLLAEAYARARAAGVDWPTLYKVMSTGAARSGTLEKMVGPALDGDYRGARFSIENSRKDIDYYRALAAQMDGAPSPRAEALFELLDAAVAQGHGSLFVSELLRPDVVDPLLTDDDRNS